MPCWGCERSREMIAVNKKAAELGLKQSKSMVCMPKWLLHKG